MNSVIGALDRISQIRGRFDQYFAKVAPPRVATDSAATGVLAQPTNTTTTSTTSAIGVTGDTLTIDQLKGYNTNTQLARTIGDVTQLGNIGNLGQNSRRTLASALGASRDSITSPLEPILQQHSWGTGTATLPSSSNALDNGTLALKPFKDLLSAHLKSQQSSQDSIPFKELANGTNRAKGSQLGTQLGTQAIESPIKSGKWRPLSGSEDTFPYRSEITAAAKRYGLPVALVRSVVQAESNFNPVAVSRKGAMGLMQLMPKTVAMLGVKDPYDVTANLMGGARYLRELLDQYGGDYTKALAAYNAGEVAVKRAIKETGASVPPYTETNTYIKKILTSYMKYSGVRS